MARVSPSSICTQLLLFRQKEENIVEGVCLHEIIVTYLQQEELYMNSMEKKDYAPVFFKEGTPASVKRRGLVFFTILTLLVLGLAFYWMFANRVEPIILGLPFSLFFITALIVLEFIVLLVMYLTDPEENRQTGGAQ